MIYFYRNVVASRSEMPCCDLSCHRELYCAEVYCHRGVA